MRPPCEAQPFFQCVHHHEAEFGRRVLIPPAGVADADKDGDGAGAVGQHRRDAVVTPHCVAFRLPVKLCRVYPLQVRAQLAAGAARHVLAAVHAPARDRLQPVMCRSEEQTSELQSLMRISYAVFYLKNKNKRMKYDIYSPHTTT